MPFYRLKNIVHFITRAGTIINRMFRPLVQLKIDRFYDLKTTHSRYSLNKVPGIALPHVPPLVLNIFLLKTLGSGA